MRQWWVRHRPDRAAEEDSVCECEELRAEVERLRAEVATVSARVHDVFTREAENTHQETGDSLLDRLRGIYTIPVNDGAGLLNGKDTFTRRFFPMPICAEAAAEIERLQSLARTALDERDYWKGVAESYEGGG